MTTKTVFAEFNSWSDFQTKLLSFNKKEKKTILFRALLKYLQVISTNQLFKKFNPSK